MISKAKSTVADGVKNMDIEESDLEYTHSESESESEHSSSSQSSAGNINDKMH